MIRNTTLQTLWIILALGIGSAQADYKETLEARDTCIEAHFDGYNRSIEHCYSRAAQQLHEEMSALVQGLKDYPEIAKSQALWQQYRQTACPEFERYGQMGEIYFTECRQTLLAQRVAMLQDLSTYARTD